MTASAAQVVDVDPDIEQSIEDLGPVAARLRAVEQRLLTIDPTMEYRKYIGARAEAGQCRDQIALRAKRDVIHPAALVVILDQAHRLTSMFGRKPRHAQMARALQDHAGTMQQRVERKRARLAQAHADAAIAERECAEAEEAARRYVGAA